MNNYPLPSSSPTKPRRKRIGLYSLPVELLKHIFLNLSTYDMDILPRVCKTFRMALKSDFVFANTFLSQQARHLSYLIHIPICISSLDRFDIAFNTRGHLVFHHARTSVQKSDVYIFTLDLLGLGTCIKKSVAVLPPCITAITTFFSDNGGLSPHTWKARSFSDPRDSLIITDAHRSRCRLCRTLQITSMAYMVDKSYRVFFQTWGDTLDFILPNKVNVKIQISHREEPDSSFSAVSTVSGQTVTVKAFRYDLFQNEDDLERIKGFTRLTGYRPGT